MNLLSLFDYSGGWSQPYRNNGWRSLQVDIKFPDVGASPAFRDVFEFNTVEELYAAIPETTDGMICAPPCTDFAGSGARWWAGKDADGTTEKSIDLLYRVFDLVEILRPDFWVIENPVGRLNSLIPEKDFHFLFEGNDRPNFGKPQYFNPCDYAGYLDLSSDDLDYLAEIDKKDGVGVTFADWEHIIKCNAYTKKTGLWGEFTMPEPKPIKPVKSGGPSIGTSAMNRLGGKSDRTKELRSNAPDGFGKAFFEVNQGGYNRWISEMDGWDYIQEQLETNPVNPKDTRALSVIKQTKEWENV